MSFQVSVVIPAYNAEKYVRKAVESCIALPQVAEIILINDFSPDGTWKVCCDVAREFKQVRLAEHKSRRNEGAGASRNLGISLAKCDFIAFLDADDWYLPNRFDTDEGILSSDAAVDGVYNALGNYYESEELRTLWLSQNRPEVLTLTDTVPPEKLSLVLLHAHHQVSGEFSTDTITVRKTLFERSGYFHTALRLQQDTHLWKRMSLAGRLAAGNIKTPVAIRRVHPENRMTRTADHQQYMDLWFQSLFGEFRRLKAGFAEMQALRYLYCQHLIQNSRTLPALASIARLCVNNPGLMTVEYGQFDLLLRSLFDSSTAVNRLLSAKNRLVRVLSGTTAKLK